MSNRANPAVIGAFVVGAVALAVTGLLIFGSGKLFKRTTKAVCFFTGDVMGLNVGAPVKFKGVDVGSVAEVRLRWAKRLTPAQVSRVEAELQSLPVRLKRLGFGAVSVERSFVRRRRA